MFQLRINCVLLYTNKKPVLFKTYNAADMDSIKFGLIAGLINLKIMENLRAKKKYKKKNRFFIFKFLIFGFNFLILIYLFYYIINKLYICDILF